MVCGVDIAGEGISVALLLYGIAVVVDGWVEWGGVGTRLPLRGGVGGL